VASKLLQKYFIAILETRLVKTVSNAFCRLAAADFFMIVVWLYVSFPRLSISLTGSCSPLFVLGFKKRYIHIDVPTCKSCNNVSAVHLDILHACPCHVYMIVLFAVIEVFPSTVTEFCVFTLFPNYRLIYAPKKIPSGTF